jgi:hypothetical protein
MQAYVEGVSTRRVDDLVIAMGGTGISKSEVSRNHLQVGPPPWPRQRTSAQAASRLTLRERLAPV